MKIVNKVFELLVLETGLIIMILSIVKFLLGCPFRAFALLCISVVVLIFALVIRNMIDIANIRAKLK